MSNLGLVISTARRANGWTQEQLAEKAGVSQVEPEILERLSTSRLTSW
jgi:transcriptional regulator with XRE-family HTH domain